MAESGFTKEDWLQGKEPAEGRGLIETMLGVVAVNVESTNGRDRHDSRYGRQKAGARRDQRFAIDASKPQRIKDGAIVKATRFVESRLARLPLLGKRERVKGVPTHLAETIVKDDRVAIAEGRLDAMRRRVDLRDSEA